MKNLIIISIVSLMTIMSSCTKDEQIFGSGRIVSEYRNVNEFFQINSSGIFDINIAQGEVQSVEVMADDNIVHEVRTEVFNNELRLYLDENQVRGVTLKVNITVKNLDAIKNSGTGNIVANYIQTDESFSVYNSGTGNIEINGSAKSLILNTQGSGNFSGFDFAVEAVKVKNRGSGSVEVFCSKSLEASISGSGNVYYKGNPSINISTSGSGNFIAVN